MNREEILERLMSRSSIHFYINCAISLDSKLSRIGERVDISTTEDWKTVMTLRNNAAAIVVGSNTVMIDNPTLKTREEYLETEDIRHPIRIVLDRRGKLSTKHMIFNTLYSDVLWLTSKQVETPENVYPIYCSRTASVSEICETITSELDKRGVKGGVLVEGGASVITSFLNSGQIHTMRIFRRPMSITNGVSLFVDDIHSYLKPIYVGLLDEGIEEFYSVTHHVRT